MLFATRFFLIRIIVFFRNCRKLYFYHSLVVYSSSFKSFSLLLFFDLNFYTMKFSMFSIFRSRSLLASFFSISHVASFVNYFFHLFSSPASGALLPATACPYYQTYPSLSTAFLFFLLLFFLISLFLFYTPPCLPHIPPAYPYLLTFT